MDQINEESIESDMTSSIISKRLVSKSLNKHCSKN